MSLVTDETYDWDLLAVEEPSPCFVCGLPAFWVSFSFEAPIHRGPCHASVMWAYPLSLKEGRYIAPNSWPGR